MAFEHGKKFKSLKMDSNKCLERTKKWLLHLVVKDTDYFHVYIFSRTEESKIRLQVAIRIFKIILIYY